MEETSLVSVIIPVYNGENYLGEAIRSVLDQSRPPVEIIIVDDGSTDKTSEVAAGFGAAVSYFYQRNSGPSAARNRGITMARGSMLGFIDADDLWPVNHLELLLRPMADRAAIDIVVGRVQLIITSVMGDGGITFEKFADPALTLNLGSVLYRKSVFDKVGLFDPVLRFSEDADWFMRARESNVTMHILDEVTLFYRRHGGNMTLNMLGKDINLVKVLKKSLDRRRGENTGRARTLPSLYGGKEDALSHRHEEKRGLTVDE